MNVIQRVGAKGPDGASEVSTRFMRYMSYDMIPCNEYIWTRAGPSQYYVALHVDMTMTLYW